MAEVDQVCIDLNTNNVCDANELGENISNQSYDSLTVDLPNRSDGEGAISDGKYYVLARNSDGSYSKSNNTFKYERVPALFSVSPGFYNVEGDRPKEMAGGNSHKIILMESGQVFTGLLANGSNDSGQLGIGEFAGDSQDLYNITSRFAEGDKIISVSALGSFNLALSEKGRVYAWENNQYGQIGNGSDKNVWEPLDITSRFGDKQIIIIKAGWEQSFALASDGTLFAWGHNNSGQLGLGDQADRSTPTIVSGIDGQIVSLATDSHTLALTSDGKLYSWG